MNESQARYKFALLLRSRHVQITRKCTHLPPIRDRILIGGTFIRQLNNPYIKTQIDEQTGRPTVYCSKCNEFWICAPASQLINGVNYFEVVRDMFLEGRDDEAITIIYEFMEHVRNNPTKEQIEEK